MIKNRNIDRGAKKHKFVSARHDLSAASLGLEAFVDSENPIKITGVDLIYTVATSSHTQGETMLVGTYADTDKYCDATVAVSTAAGTVTAQTVLNPTVNVAAGTAVVVQRSAATGTSNTGEVQIVVTYEFVDVTANRG